MKKKTVERLKKREEIKSQHSIDTSIFLSVLFEDDNLRICERYLARVGNLFVGHASLPVYGEVLSKFVDEKDSSKLLQQFIAILNDRKIKFYTPKEEAFKICLELKKIDPRLSYTDILILACAIERGDNFFVTLDKDLINNQGVERRYNIKIRNPTDFVN